MLAFFSDGVTGLSPSSILDEQRLTGVDWNSLIWSGHKASQNFRGYGCNFEPPKMGFMVSGNNYVNGLRLGAPIPPPNHWLTFRFQLLPTICRVLNANNTGLI